MKKIFFSIIVMIVIFACISVIYIVGSENFLYKSVDFEKNQNQQKIESIVPANITATLSVCGDIMSHMPQTRDAWSVTQNKYDYSPMISGATEWVSKADYAVANLETTFAGEPDYSGYPTFNTPDELSDALKNAGFDLLLTANNHCMDKGYDGLVRTLDVLDERGISHVGTYRTKQERNNNNGIVIADVGGISVAFLGYTYGTNGIPIANDKMFSVNLFNIDYLDSLSDFDEEKILYDLKAANELNTDLIAVMIHWGTEYKIQENEYQQKIAQFLLDNGVDIILGGHPHVLQPMGLCTKTEEDGEQTQGFISYSLGNFISAQKDRYTDITVVLNIELEKNGQTGKAQVKSYSYVPMLMVNRGSQAEIRFELLDVYKALSQAGESQEIMQKLNQCLIDCHNILGQNEDIGQIAV